MKKLIYLLILGVLVSGCKKKSDNDDAGDNQNYEPGTVVLYLNNQKIFEKTATIAVYDAVDKSIGIDVRSDSDPNIPMFTAGFFNYIPPVGSSSVISDDPETNETGLVMESVTHFNTPDGHPFVYVEAISGQLKHLSNKKFEATGTVRNYYDPYDDTIYSEMTFKLVFVVKVTI